MDGGYIYTHGCQGPGGAGMPGLMSALCFGLHCLATEGLTHRHTVIHANTKRTHSYTALHTPLWYLYVRGKKRGWLSTRACGTIMR